MFDGFSRFVSIGSRSVTWVLSPKYGLLSTLLRRADQRRRFDNQVVLGHIYNHQYTDTAHEELSADELYQHFRWPRARMQRVLARLRASNLVRVSNNVVHLTPNGENRVETFRQRNLLTGPDAPA